MSEMFDLIVIGAGMAGVAPLLMRCPTAVPAPCEAAIRKRFCDAGPKSSMPLG